MYKRIIKPTLDKFVGLAVFLALLPVVVIAALLLSIVNRGTPFFVQPRPGLNGRIFYLIKFKTMTDAVDEQGNLLPDEKRLTAIGKLVRKTSVDELPQLLNVLKGDMSIVGPRPLLTEYLSLYNEVQRRRHEVRPGITGWAQVNGRNTLEWKQRFALDVWYVDHQSFILDLKILLLTLLKVFKAEGISSGTSVTMEKFRGN